MAANDETRLATPPAATTPSTAAKPVGEASVGLNSPLIPDYSSHDKLQTSHRGQYSIERMLALHDYAQRVSLTRVAVVCVLTPVPALTIALLLQLIKVETYNPVTWRQNTPFWIFTAILSFIFAASVTVQARQMMPTYPISLIKTVLVSGGTATAMVLILDTVGRAWMFPVPFSFVLAMAPFLLVWSLLFLVLVRRKPFPQAVASSALPPSRFFAFVVVQLVMIVSFAAFEILLVNLEGKVLAKKLTFLLYQTIRNIFKHTAACYLLRHVQDFVPELVVFSVELFVAWYMLFEIMVAYDADALSAILGTVFLSAVTGMIHLNKRLKKLQELREQAKLPKNGVECMHALVDALRRPDALDEAVLKGMRLHATGGHALPTDLTAIVDHLQAMPAFLPAPACSEGGSRNAAAVVPLAAPATSANADATAKSMALHQTLVVLFNAEYVVLMKYVETIAPLLYVVFVYVLFDGGMANLWSFPYIAALKLPVMEHLHTDVGFYSALMIALPVVLACLLSAQLRSKQLGVAPLHQLAFVLENQQLQIQAKLIAYLLFAVHFVMLHYGTDFQAVFAWKQFFQ